MSKKKQQNLAAEPRWASVDEMREAKDNLSPTDSLRIVKYARSRVRVIRLYTEFYTHEDLIGKAYLQMLKGKRNWDKAKIPFVVFFIGIMKSIAGHILRDESKLVPERGIMTEEGDFTDPTEDLPALGSDPITIAAAEQKARKFLESFADDQDVLNYIESKDAGLTQKETEECCDMTPQRYDAARKRFNRRLEKYETEGEL